MKFTKVLYPPSVNLENMFDILIKVNKGEKVYFCEPDLIDERHMGKLGRFPLVRTNGHVRELSSEGKEILDCYFKGDKLKIIQILTTISVSPHLHFFAFIIWYKENLTINQEGYWIGKQRLIDVILRMINFMLPDSKVSNGTGRYNYERRIVELAKQLGLIFKRDITSYCFNRETSTAVSYNFHRIDYISKFEKVTGR
jgi:hypothetical protein